MARRTFRIAFEVLAGLVAGFAILIGVGVWRLSEGPINLDFLAPYVEEAINSEGSPVHVEIEGTALTWGGWERAVDIVARNVVVAPAEAANRPVAKLPEVSFTLSMRALTQGVVAPTTLEILRPRIALRRLPSGALGLSLAPSTLEGDGLSDDEVTPIDRVLADLQDFMRPPDRDHVLGYLTRLSIYNAKGRFRDYHSGRNWRMRDVTFDLLRDEKGVSLSLAGHLSQGNYSGSVTLTAEKPFSSLSGVVALRSDGFDLGLIDGLVPGLKPGDLADEVMSLNAEIALRENGIPLNWQFDATSDELGHVAVQGVTVNTTTGLFEGRLSVDAVSPARWAALSPALEQAKAIEGPVTADISVTGAFARDDFSNILIDQGRLSLTSDGGRFDVPMLYPEVIEHNGLSVEANFARGFDRIDVTSLRLDLPEGLLEASAVTDLVDAQRHLTVSGRLTDFDMAYLGKLWPPALGEDARVWVVENITEGPVPEATINLEAMVDADGNVDLQELGGEISLNDAIVHYFRPLPPATNVSGVAKFGPDWFDIDVGGGHVGDIAIGGGKIKISDIGGEETDESIDIALDITAPFRDALELVDHDPLNLVSGIGFDPDTISGDAKGHVEFAFPLLNDLKTEQVQVQVDATLDDLVMQEAFKDLSARGSGLKMTVDNDGFQVSGRVVVAEVPLIAAWQENFSDAVNLRKTLTVAGRMDEAKLAELGYNLIPYLDGDIDLNLESREFRDGHAELDLAANLQEAGLLAPPLNWMKPRTYPASLSLSAGWTDGGAINVSPVEFNAETLSFKGSAALMADQATIRQVLINEMRLDGSAIQGSAIRGDDGGYVVDLRGEAFDISGILDMFEGGDDKLDTEGEEAPTTPFVLNSQFDLVTAGPARRLLDARLAVHHDGNALQHLDLDAKAKDGSAISMDYGLGVEGFELQGSLENAGAALRSVHGYDGINGGRATIRGHRASEKDPLVGRVEMKDFVLIKAPAMAKVLEFMSLTGTLNALTSEGLPFSNFQADYSLDGSQLHLKKVKVFGASVGVSLSGDYDIKHDRIAASGTVVPAYAINRALGAIPVIGWILTGGEDGGLFGANYSVSGPLDDPNVTVNPLSALTPGALRRLFDIFPNNPALDQEQKKGGEEKDPTPPPDDKR